ncbi:glucuronate isomerase [Paenalkalicoccus suaedae]|uniref:Uronate isomerase n=1 Tax=Paenalkalicoccus suaedae TaxID=2592382 RepID=A0A859FHF2_9BACI|nr:glucuronate isomerase [Paenalkalicoccus suaedae]QKS72501.1 glucuronate isomerase [Paenalkalicoccus suaedae]
MTHVITDDFLLSNEVARRLYHEVAKDLPIIDYHNHLSAKEIYEDKSYASITELWLGGDHYKWRAMRANGEAERFITGDAPDEEKFQAWARTVPNTLGNPLYHWTHLELTRFFDYKGLLSERTAEDVFNHTNTCVQSGELSARRMLEMQRVEFVGTTDDPTDDLSYHRKLQEEGYAVTVAPSFRPDVGLAIEADTFIDWIERLAKASGVTINTYHDLLAALENRVAFFSESGCKASDHGINEMVYEQATEEEVATIFDARLKGASLTESDVRKFKTVTLQQLAMLYEREGWVMQLHIGPLRNNFTAKLHTIGRDAGFDAIGDAPLAKPLNAFLDSLASSGTLPKTILYTLNPRDNVILAATAGNFQEEGVPGKVQVGTAWWFNDHHDGMLDQMKTLANVGLLRHFVGMLTDSRSMLSFTRHEYFRRILCDLLGTWVVEGKIPNDQELLTEYVEGICYHNAKHYFQLTKETILR